MAQELQLADVSQSESFWFTWKVENIHLSNLKMREEITTPVFKVGILQNTMWQFRLASAGIDDPMYMGCTLARMPSERQQDEPEEIKLEWKISVIGEGGTVRFERLFESVFKRQDCMIVQGFIDKSTLLPTGTPQNNLTIYCQMTNNPRFSEDQDLKCDLEMLSSDLLSLLESGFRSDLIMFCDGRIFNVHKYILLSRWPDFCESFEIDNISDLLYLNVPAIKSSTLKSFLTFLYSGRLQRKDISMELCSYMHEQFCDFLMESLETPVSNIEFVTHMHYEWKHLTWEIGDDNDWKMCRIPFYRVIPLEEVYPAEMVIIFSFEERNGEEWLKLGVEFTGFNSLAPLLLDGELSFIGKGAVVHSSSKFNHLIETRDTWYFPPLVKKSDLLPNERNNKSIEISLCICDGSSPSRQVSTSIDNASRFREVKDLRKLMADLVTTSYKSDLILKFGDQAYRVHSLLLAARSEKFRKLIEDNHEVIEIEHMSRNASDSFIRHLYGEKLLDLDIASIIMLNTMARKYSFSSLEEKTRLMLEGQFI